MSMFDCPAGYALITSDGLAEIVEAAKRVGECQLAARNAGYSGTHRAYIQGQLDAAEARLASLLEPFEDEPEIDDLIGEL